MSSLADELHKHVMDVVPTKSNFSNKLGAIMIILSDGSAIILDLGHPDGIAVLKGMIETTQGEANGKPIVRH